MRRAYHHWFSPHVHRDMELLVFGHAGARVLVFPTRDGRFYDYENWRLVETLRPKIEAGYLQLFCVDSHDRYSLYADWMRPEDRMARHEDFEGYILDEVLPFSRALNPDPFAIAHGCSLGAYHAVNIALRHPDQWGKVVALSGRYDLVTPVGPFRSLTDGHWDARVAAHTPAHYAAQIPDGPRLHAARRLQIVIAVGADDWFLHDNRAFSASLWARGIGHELHVWGGEAHRARDWRQMVSIYL